MADDREEREVYNDSSVLPGTPDPNPDKSAGYGEIEGNTENVPVALRLFKDRQTAEKKKKGKTTKSLSQKREDIKDIKEACRQEAGEIMVACQNPDENHACWRQDCADLNDELSLEEFLMISNHCSDGTALDICVDADTLCSQSIKYLQRKYVRRICYFQPYQKGWSAKSRFSMAMAESPHLADKIGWNGVRDGKPVPYPSWFRDLLAAVLKDDFQYVRDLVNNDGGKTLLNYPDNNGRTVLHSAAREASVEMIKFLISNGCRVNVCDDYGKTPLHDACWTTTDRSEVIWELVKACPDILNAVDHLEATPLEYVPAKSAQLHQSYFEMFEKNGSQIFDKCTDETRALLGNGRSIAC